MKFESGMQKVGNWEVKIVCRKKVKTRKLESRKKKVEKEK